MNGRGQYGASNGYRFNGYYATPRVGLVHTPQDTEDEMNQLHNEMMQFGTEVISHVKAAENDLKAQPGYQTILKKVRAADADYQSIKAKAKSREDLAARLARALKVPQFDGQALAEPWVKNTVRLPHVVAADPDLAKDHDVFLQRVEAVSRLNAVQSELRDEYNRLFQASTSPLLIWESRIWEPFWSEWKSWHSDHLRPAQLWPGSGAWDRIQDYRAKYIEIRNKAPFKATGPAPITPETRRDPSLLGGLASFASAFKWVALGVLGIGGALAVSAVASNIKKKGR